MNVLKFSFYFRDAIRQTWGNLKDPNYPDFHAIRVDEKDIKPDKSQLEKIRIVFLVGKSEVPIVQEALEKEFAENTDILQENFIDTQENATIKSMFMLKWATLNRCIRQCKKVTYRKQFWTLLSFQLNSL